MKRRLAFAFIVIVAMMYFKNEVKEPKEVKIENITPIIPF